MTTATEKNVSSATLEFTGERFVPGKTDPQLALEHYHRYLFALPYVKGKRVLDIACGEGYGSALLVTAAATVTGVDSDAKTVAHARERYGSSKKIEFLQGSCNNIPLEDGSIDVVVCLETFEHLDSAEQKGFLQEIKRILAAGGMMILSTPDLEEYGKGRADPNPFHKHELKPSNLRELLATSFRRVDFFGQRLLTLSALWKLDGWKSNTFSFLVREDFFKPANPVWRFAAPVYIVALCSDGALPEEIGANSFYYDTREVEWVHDLSSWARSLNSELDERKNYLAKLQQEFDERSVWAADLNAESEVLKRKIAAMQKEFDERSAWALKLEEEIKEHREASGRMQNEFDERSTWAKRLDEENAGLKKRVYDLQKELDERSAWVLTLQQELSERKDYISNRQTEFEERTAWVHALEAKLSASERKVAELTLWGSMLDRQVHRITSSFLYRWLAAIGLLPKREA